MAGEPMATGGTSEGIEDLCKVKEARRRECEGFTPRKRKDDSRHMKAAVRGAVDMRDPLLVTNKKRNDKIKIEEVRKNVTKLKRTELVNLKEEKSLVPRNKIEVVRRYQLDVLERASQVNTIVYLETGCGKTLIAVLLIRKLGYKLRNKEEKLVVVFLAPTVHLVLQQSEVLKINTDLKVGSYFGAKGVDLWSSDIWQAEINKNEVLVMTPQVFLDALRHSFIKMNAVELLILDECHHAQKHHAYAKVMREYYHPSIPRRPKIFGMTASPVIRKGVASVVDCADQLQRLEHMLDSKVYTLQDRIELECYVPTPNQKTEYYEKSEQSFEFIMVMLSILRDKDPQCYENESGNRDRFKDDVLLLRKLKKQIKGLHMSLEYCLRELGIWCALKGAEVLLKKYKKDVSVETDAVQIDSLHSCKSFLEEALEVLRSALPEEVSVNTEEDIVAAVSKGILTPKVQLLVRCLLSYRDVLDMRCIVFVERVVGAIVLAEVTNNVGCLSFLHCHYMAGITSGLDAKGRRQQQQALEDFRSGKVNVLMATDVAEEGLDVQSCSSVIRFDLPKTVRSFIQSRGRARRPGSDYMIFLERRNEKQEELLFDLLRSEESMRSQALGRTHMSAYPELKDTEETDFYRVESTGATVNTDCSISFIYRFCSKLPGDKYYNPRPEFSFKEDAETSLYVCVLILPPNGPFSELVGTPKRNLLLAKQVVCLEACKKLHIMGHITDYLLPMTEVDKPAEEVMNMGGKKRYGAGSTKRKELHPTATTVSLHGNWINRSGGVDLQAYKLSFRCIGEENNIYADFGFLIETILDVDVANTEVTLFLTKGRMVTAKIIRTGEIHLTSIQLQEAKAYQEVIFNGMFGKLIRRNNNTANVSAHSSAKLLFASSKKMKKLWGPSQMYLLLPLIDFPGGEGIHIDWKTINASATAVYLLTLISCHEDHDSNDRMSESAEKCISTATEGGQMLHFADVLLPSSRVVDMAVITIHTGRIYCVTRVLHGKNADCPFPGSLETKASEYSSYTDYFKKKYGKVLQFPKQPLLQLKQRHRLYNLLEKPNGNLKDNGLNEKVNDNAYVDMPPELCLNLGVSSSIVRSLYLVPSVMHRLNALILASELRHHIQKDASQCGSILAIKLMKALTTLRCLEGFSFEGLELLGDSFLKYAVSRYLFVVYDQKHEGQLSARRCHAICNATLHRLATARNLPSYIRDEPFDASLWVAPGMLCPKVVRCRCNLSNLSCPESPVETEDNREKVFKIGKACNKGHRWMCSKTVADAVEALIGAYFVESPDAAMDFMIWLGMEVEFDAVLIERARWCRSVDMNVLQTINVESFEEQLGYSFANKALLVESITHASHQDPHGGFCYQRLEFLGDAVLDLLITNHLFLHDPGLSPGVLTDLRSAAVNNECFARAAVKHNLQRYLRHGSGALLSQITGFVKAVQEASDTSKQHSFGWEGVKGPKVLGDLVESIAGAIAVDSGFDLDKVWKVMKPILSPIVTPETLPLQPIRELYEVCHIHRYEFSWKKLETDGQITYVTAELDLGQESLSVSAQRGDKKAAQKDAAHKMLLLLESEGIRHPRRQRALDGCKRYLDVNELKPNSGATNASPSETVQEAFVGKKRCTRNEFDSIHEERKKPKLTGGFIAEGSEEFLLQSRSNSSETAALNVLHESLIGAESQVEQSNALCDTIYRKGEPLAHKQDEMKEANAEQACIRHSAKDNEIHQPLEQCRSQALQSGRVIVSNHVDSCSTLLPSLPNTPEVTEGMTKLDDGKELSSSDNSSFLPRFIENKSDGHLNEGEPLLLGTCDKGFGRTRLYELCSKQKWPYPEFMLSKEEGVPHSRWFSFSVVIDVPLKGRLEAIGMRMSCKKAAKEAAALSMLLTLRSAGLC